ncbi:MAG: DUF1353 domain-containing protein [Pseudomonadota bacterium]
MSRYTDLTEWHRPGDDGKFVLTKDILWEVGREGSGLLVTVPTGYVFDVSIPWYLRWALDPADPRFRKASAMHDWVLDDGWDRVSAGAAFSDGLRADGVGRLQRLLMVLAVVAFRFR